MEQPEIQRLSLEEEDEELVLPNDAINYEGKFKSLPSLLRK